MNELERKQVEGRGMSALLLGFYAGITVHPEVFPIVVSHTEEVYDEHGLIVAFIVHTESGARYRVAVTPEVDG
jgi:hypothetical protein